MRRYRFILDNTNFVRLFDCKLDKKIGIVYYRTENNLLMLPRDKCFCKKEKNYYFQIGRHNIQN